MIIGDVVVVGAGLGGVLAARELLRAGWRVLLVDPGARAGRGVAYSTKAPWHLLNSPASVMSAEPDDPDHFLAWCRERDPATGPGDFISRAWYGDYLAEALRAADELGPLTLHRGRVVRIFEGERMVVLLEDGIVMLADRMVLALGNAAPAQPFQVGPRTTHYVADPWRPEALESLPEGPVILIGSGLTAVDVALTLARAGDGRHPKVTMVSRHGLLPLAHQPYQRIALEKPPGRTLSQLLGSVRKLVARHGDWRAVMDALRPHWNDLWLGLDAAGQERFVRHVARYWEVHRHRMAPSVAAELERHTVAGIFEVVKARVDTLPAGVVVNCTGPGRLITTDPLARSLVADGLAQPGPHGLGFDVDEHGELIRPGERPSRIYALGSARKGQLWETTAAPEIRAQAHALASHLSGDQALSHTMR